ncbi:MAG: molybdopterin-dependent oxidoreductase, partial [Actinobacteria bacterium]|nr:molybdopterin-dependent oxidoreductase [Actinomycetota bacterium]
MSPSRSCGTSSVPPASAWSPGSPPSAANSSSELGRTSCNALPFSCFPQCLQDLLARDRQRRHVGASGVADRVRDRRRRRDDRRLAEPFRPQVREVLVRHVDELTHDLRHVGERRQLVRVERAGEDRARARVVEPRLREGVAHRLDDPALDLAAGAKRVDHAPDVVHRVDALDDDLARLDVDCNLGDLHAKGQDAHPCGVGAPRALAEDLAVLEKPGDLLERPRAAVRRDDLAAPEREHVLLEVEERLLSLNGGNIVSSDGGSWPLEEITGLLQDGQILGKGARGPNPAGLRVLTFGVQVAEVAVDVETGEVVVEQIYAVHDVGRVINPLGARSQIEGGIIQAMGHTFSEARLDDPRTGSILTRTLDAYK